MTFKAALSLGANINPKKHLKTATKTIVDRFEVLAVSPVYQTKPIGMEAGADDFHNSCLLLNTELNPDRLKSELRSIERDQGRRRNNRENDDFYAPRRIDLDIVFYDPLPDGFTPSAELVGHAYVVYPLSDVCSPPSFIAAETREEWRDTCSSEEIVGRVQYSWPDDIRLLVSEYGGSRE